MKKYGLTVVCVLLAIFVGILIYENISLKQQVDEMFAVLDNYREKEAESHVIERISKQMENIAYQQKDISDKQREEAVFQMEMADKMRLRAEKEQRKAQEYADNVVEARNMMEIQREAAIELQHKAESARKSADTLSFIALGRSLASFSNAQYHSGNRDIAALLAYASWNYTTDYMGNVYIPSIFNALILNSGNFISTGIHKEGVSRILCDNSSENRYVSVGRYGEICRWSYNKGKWNKQMLFSDPKYDFRDMCLDNHSIYALSYDGMLLILSDGNEPQEINIDASNSWLRVCLLGSEKLLLVSSHSLMLFDKIQKRILKTIPLSQPLASVGEKDGLWIIFCQDGSAWTLTDDYRLKPFDVFLNKTVCAYAWSPKLRLGALGVENGDIYLTDESGNIIHRMIGHRSKITQLGFHGNSLISASYDCMLNLWDMRSTKMEPVTLKAFSSWIYCFCLSSDMTIWVGEKSGTISRLMISPEQMAKVIQRNLKRDFTDDEWSYYVGANVPRKRFMITE